jgi:DNA (cytosine-5)-methyltransferase 1
MFMHPDIAWRVRDLPPLPGCSQRVEDIVEALPLNHKMWWSRPRCDYMLNQMSPKHRAQADRMIQGEEISYGTVFRRVRHGKCMAELRIDGIAGCLRTPRGGSGRQILLAAGKGRFSVRLLTPRECARLMGAGDFVLKVPLNQALFGFGDAVCVPVIEWIAHNYLNPLWSEVYGEEKRSRLAAPRAKHSKSAR